jgi:predicted RNase H-like nuclease (RuvC/YqgF family)
MKRVFILLAISLFLAGGAATAQVPAPTGPMPAAPTNDPAAPAATAASIAAQQAAEERYKRMAADIEALQMDHDSLKAKITALEQKIDDLRQQQTANANTINGVLEDLKRVAESIVAVDKKREEDKQAIAEEIRQSIASLKKALAESPAPAHELPPKLQPDAETPATENGFTYTVQAGQNLSSIVEAYNADFKKKGWKQISVKQAEEANPKVKDWNHVHVGQQIFIPKPEPQ